MDAIELEITVLAFDIPTANLLGILPSGDYITSALHGGEEGYLAFEIGEDQLFPVLPYDVRDETEVFFGLRLQASKRLVICPCHPAAVRAKFEKELSACQVDILGNWSGITRFQAEPTGPQTAKITLCEKGN